MSRLTRHPLAGKHRGKVATVVGRGPSLLKLDEEDFADGPVITINQALSTVRKLKLAQPLYSLQKAKCLVKPKAGETLILSKASQNCFNDFRNRYTIPAQWFGLVPGCMSTTYAVALAHLMGCSRVRFLACDGYTIGDHRHVVNGRVVDIGARYGPFAGRQATSWAKTVRIPLEWVEPGL